MRYGQNMGKRGWNVADDQCRDDESMHNEAYANMKEVVNEETCVNKEEVINDVLKNTLAGATLKDALF